MIISCSVCLELLVNTKDCTRRHEARVHDYIEMKYDKHHAKPLSKEKINEIAVKGEERIGSHLFFGYNPLVAK